MASYAQRALGCQCTFCIYFRLTANAKRAYKPRMRLSEYLHENGLTETGFAETLGVDQSTIHRLAKKEQIPGRELMVRIHEATKGQVTANDFFGIAA